MFNSTRSKNDYYCSNINSSTYSYSAGIETVGRNHEMGTARSKEEREEEEDAVAALACALWQPQPLGLHPLGRNATRGMSIRFVMNAAVMQRQDKMPIVS